MIEKHIVMLFDLSRTPIAQTPMRKEDSETLNIETWIHLENFAAAEELIGHAMWM